MNRLLGLIPLLVLATGCPGDDGGDADDGSDTNDTDPTSGLPPLEGPPKGDFSCLTPAASFADVTWAPAQTPHEANVDESATANITVLDFEHEEPRASRTVSLWYDDVAAGEPDVQGTVDDNGRLDLQAPSCTPISYLTKELPGLEDAKDTYKAHQILAPEGGAVEFQSVSISTYRVIPTVVGLSVSPDKGVVAGTMYDCARDPATLSSVDAGKVEGVRVRAYVCPSANAAAADCTEPLTGVQIKYFVENFPSRDQPWTSEDGLWLIANVPPGTYRVEAYGLFDGEEKVVGATVVTVYADSINIGNIWAGYPDGVKYPYACLVPPT